MIPFLPDQPAAASLHPRLPFQPGAGSESGARTGGRNGSSGLDFAGLLDTALPTEAVPVMVPVPVPVPDAGLLPELDGAPLVPPLAGGAPASGTGTGTASGIGIATGSGTNLPDSGEDLPPEPISPQPVPQPVTNLPIASLPGAIQSAAPEPQQQPQSQPQPQAPGATNPPQAAVVMTDILETLHISLPALVTALPQPDTPVPAPVPASTGIPAAPLPVPPLRAASGHRLPVAGSEPIAENAAADEAADGAALPGLRAAAPDASQASETVSAPATPAPAGAAPATALAQSPAAAGPLVPAERAEPRAPAPQLESTIAQVGELREALRAARPEMTLRHAEFGFVSLRLEATGAVQDWRAVLTSRDPGFVPAIQAALAERAVAASADTASTGSGTNTTGHGQGQGQGQGGGFASEQRYGSSPGSGQGSSQPYSAQSFQREDGADQQQRRADEAETGSEPHYGDTGRRERGLFA